MSTCSFVPLLRKCDEAPSGYEWNKSKTQDRVAARAECTNIMSNQRDTCCLRALRQTHLSHSAPGQCPQSADTIVWLVDHLDGTKNDTANQVVEQAEVEANAAWLAEQRLAFVSEHFGAIDENNDKRLTAYELMRFCGFLGPTLAPFEGPQQMWREIGGLADFQRVLKTDAFYTFLLLSAYGGPLIAASRAHQLLWVKRERDPQGDVGDLTEDLTATVLYWGAAWLGRKVVCVWQWFELELPMLDLDACDSRLKEKYTLVLAVVSAYETFSLVHGVYRLHRGEHKVISALARTMKEVAKVKREDHPWTRLALFFSIPTTIVGTILFWIWTKDTRHGFQVCANEDSAFERLMLANKHLSIGICCNLAITLVVAYAGWLRQPSQQPTAGGVQGADEGGQLLQGG